MSKNYGKYARILTRLLDQKISETDLEISSAQSFTLMLIIKSGGKITQNELEKEMRLRRSSTSSLIKNLEENSYITRSNVSSDKRLKEVFITEKGIEAEAKVKEEIKKLESKLSSGISTNELELWEEISIKMIKNLEGGKCCGKD